MAFKKGVYTLDKYRQEQNANLFQRRKVGRRAREVIYQLGRHGGLPMTANVLDIGASDCALLAMLKQHYPGRNYTGMDYGFDLLRQCGDFGLARVCGDGVTLPFAADMFDLVVSTATLEHIDEPGRMIAEIRRVLKPGGAVILTTPDKFWISAAERVGIETKDENETTFNLKELRALFQAHDFTIEQCHKFMFFPVSFRYDRVFEMLLARLGLDFLLVNQVIIATKN